MGERPRLRHLNRKLTCCYFAEICRRAIFGDGLEEDERPKKLPADELKADNIPGIYIPADRHKRAAILDLLYPKVPNPVHSYFLWTGLGAVEYERTKWW